MTIDIRQGDMLAVLPGLAADSISSCVTDPPYHLTAEKRGGSGAASLNLGSPAGRSRIETGFMGKRWDGGSIAFDPETWRAVLRVMKPGGYLLAFGGTRTAHRMTCAIEDAGFEIRDTLCWLYGSGFPKSLDVSKAIDATLVHGNSHSRSMKKANASRPGEGRAGASLPNNGIMASERLANVTRDDAETAEAAMWSGWGTALKPAYEPIIMARKPLSERTVAANVLRHGTGGINIDACRVAIDSSVDDPRLGGQGSWNTGKMAANAYGKFAGTDTGSSALGRWPANVVHDGSPEVEAAFAAFDAPGQSGVVTGNEPSTTTGNILGLYNDRAAAIPRGDTGTASRFFYSAKATAADRADSKHPTVKPVDLMRWLVTLVTPPGGVVLDPFAGSGTTGEAAKLGGFGAILIEREAEYVADIRRRLDRWHGGDLPLFVR